VVQGEYPKPWFKENATLIYFLVGQVIAIGLGAASILAYMVKLETRVAIMETRGAEYSVARMAKMDEKITVIEQKMVANEVIMKRLIDEFVKDRQK
jgi:exopolysaccharide biosynthesis protein